MKMDVVGRIENMPLVPSKSLMPLYEAIVNSIHSIQDRAQQNQAGYEGKIEIVITRDKTHLYPTSEPEFGDITGFEIVDNGVGFNEENYVSFNTADSRYKKKRGGKGIGRFLWLNAFTKVDVDSHFLDGDEIVRRSFSFVPEGDGIKDLEVVKSTEEDCLTSVRLVGFFDKYRRSCPKKADTIATHLIEHCLEYFIRPDCPRIVLRDGAIEQDIDLNERFEKEIVAISSRDLLDISGSQFDVLHLRLYSPHVKDHLIHYCANSRSVRSEKVAGRLPNLSKKLQDSDGRDFVYAAYVDSPILDATVNQDRTDFIIDEEHQVEDADCVTWKAIRIGVIESARRFLEPYTAPVRQKLKVRIEAFVASDGPMYRPILRHVEDTIGLLDPESSNDAIELKLYQAYHDLQVKIKSEGIALLKEDNQDYEDEKFLEKVQAYFDKVNDINMSDLARYVCHRKFVLEFLSKQLSRRGDGKYPLEERVHQIIFPMKKTSDEISFENHNLWLLDERLVYHAFLASDKQLKANVHITTESQKEPDIIVYDTACAFVSGDEAPYPSVTIIEFKRPMRTDYKPNDNPFVQIREYIDVIKSGKARTPDGRDVPVGKGAPFMCYVIADITANLEQQAYDFELTKTPDGMGFFGYKRQYDAYIEVISYTKLVRDAKRRNAAFFDKLALPSSINI